MKTAYELAMERLGGETTDYSDEQKEALAEVDRVCDAEVAQAKFGAQARQQAAAGDRLKLDAVGEELTAEIGAIERKRERKKDAIRSGKA